jgi:serine phosphatase RsbU (regulator of sigma subunit)
MEIGRQIQTGFFPEKLPDVEGWELSAFFRPARQVSGDFYDAFPLADGRLCGFVVADVCDKGVGAALFMALTRSLLRAFAMENMISTGPENHQLGQTLTQTIRFTNDYIAETHGRANMFATLFIGVLDPGSGSLTYINCGHEPPIVKSESDRPIFLKPTGPALGMFPAVEFEAQQIQLRRGSTLLAFTDGLTDAQNGLGNQFSKERVVACLAEEPLSAEDLIALLVKKIDEHVSDAEQFDDITLMALKRVS